MSYVSYLAAYDAFSKMPPEGAILILAGIAVAVVSLGIVLVLWGAE